MLLAGDAAPQPDPRPSQSGPGWGLEHHLWSRGYARVAGVDEAGRGALAGPVVAAAVLLPYGPHPFNDSKKLSPEQRETMAAAIRGCALAWGVGFASAAEVDAHNVLQATHLAAGRALAALREMSEVDALVTDFLQLGFGGPVASPPKADTLSLGVAAASILAKTARDAYMTALGQADPRYGFAAHKGYGAPAHLRALAKHGPGAEHRLSFAPVARAPPEICRAHRRRLAAPPVPRGPHIGHRAR